MAESQSTDDTLLDKIDAPSSLDEEDTREFVSKTLDAIRDELAGNLAEAKAMTDRFDEDSDGVDDVLSPDSVDHIQVRARPFENPKVTVWLKGDNPIWANHAWSETIYPRGMNAYNAKTRTVFDVRPI